jgi:DNA-binding GntR family transcriptional regulator
MDDTYPEQRTYMRVAARLREEIGNGLLAPGSAMPSITSLCKVDNCSRRTLGHALRILENEGLVYRVAGLGYFVTVHL